MWRTEELSLFIRIFVVPHPDRLSQASIALDHLLRTVTPPVCIAHTRRRIRQCPVIRLSLRDHGIYSASHSR